MHSTSEQFKYLFLEIRTVYTPFESACLSSGYAITALNSCIPSTGCLHKPANLLQSSQALSGSPPWPIPPLQSEQLSFVPRVMYGACEASTRPVRGDGGRVVSLCVMGSIPCSSPPEEIVFTKLKSPRNFHTSTPAVDGPGDGEGDRSTVSYGVRITRSYGSTQNRRGSTRFEGEWSLMEA